MLLITGMISSKSGNINAGRPSWRERNVSARLSDMFNIKVLSIIGYRYFYLSDTAKN